MVGIIYQHKNKVNGKRYVGQTIQTLKARMKEGYFNTKFANALSKYGWDNFETTILYEIESDDKQELISSLNVIEEIVIRTENLQDDTYGYNVKAGGFNGSFKHTPEAIEKIRLASKRPNKGQFQKGQPGQNLGKTWINTEEYKKRHSTIMKESYDKSGRKSAMYGKSHTIETRQKISQANKGRVVGIYPTHSRWHTARGVVKDGCSFCEVES
jgi:group I intron endonuclease